MRYVALALFSMAKVTVLVWTFACGLVHVDPPVYEAAINAMADILAFA